MDGIIGAICGDIIGSTREFNPIKTKDFELIQSSSSFTDDTILTLAVASWLTKDDNHINKNLVKEMQKLTNEFPNVGYGGRFRKWMKQHKPQPYGSWANGSAMRVSPVAWVCDSLEETQILAKKSAQVTHNHPKGIKGAVATASAIYLARNNKSKEFIKEYIESTFNYDLSRHLNDIREDYEFEVSCKKSVPESIISFLESDSYIDTIRNAVSLGGDADTMAAISGSIASAYYDIPDDLISVCLSKLDDRLLKIYEEFNNKFCSDSGNGMLLSNIGDVPFETIEFDNGIEIIIEYVNGEDEEPTNYNGKYTSKYRKILLIGKEGIQTEKFEENPNYSENTDILNDKLQKCNQNDEYMENALEIIHEGLGLNDIKERILNNEEYIVVLWKKGESPLPIDLDMFKDVTLDLIDNASSIAELTFNVLHVVSND